MPDSSDDHILLEPPEIPKIPLPDGWTDYTLMAVLHVIALARIVVMNVVNWPDDAACDGLRLRCENDRLRSEVALLQKELDLKDARFSRLEPRKRPAYTPSERFEILVIRSIRGLSNLQLAKRFQVTVQTVQNWLRRAEAGEETVQMPVKSTRYPDFVRYIVQQFKACCPMLGRFKIAEILARAGLHLSASTVRRIVKEPPASPVEEKGMVICKDGKPIPCVFPVIMQPNQRDMYKNEPKHARKIINQCVYEHEMEHINDKETQEWYCDCTKEPSKAHPGKAKSSESSPNAATKNECCPLKKQLECLKKGLTTCSDQACYNYVANEIKSILIDHERIINLCDLYHLSVF